VGKVIKDIIEGGDGNGDGKGGKGGSIRYQNCLLDGLEEILPDESLGSLKKIVNRCLIIAYEYISAGQEKQKSRGSIIKAISEQLEGSLREGCEDRLAELLDKCLGKKIDKNGLIPGEDCERILFILYQEDLLIPAFVEDSTLKYLNELVLLYFQVHQSDNLGVTLHRLYGIEQLGDEVALQIIEKFNLKLISLNQRSNYEGSALKAANKALELLLGEPASLPFASADEIKDFFGNKKLVDVLGTYYTKYLSSILEYHFSQEAPKYLGPQAGSEWSERNQQSGGQCDTTCSEKATNLITILDSICERELDKKIQDLDILSPEQIKLFFEVGEELIRDGLFPGSTRDPQLKREVVNE
jgi:hypothetical protein